MAQECTTPGKTNSDIAGLGIMIAFAIQGGLSMIIALWAPLHILVDLMCIIVKHKKDTSDSPTSRALGNMLYKVIKVICDIQSFAGISVLVAGLSQFKTLSLYHYRVIYDMVTFTGVSYTACLLNRSIFEESPEPSQVLTNLKSKPKHLTAVSWLISQNTLIFIFSICYLAFAIGLGIRLHLWDNTAGRCYNSSGIAGGASAHPHDDLVYLGVTCYFMGIALAGCLFLSPSIRSFLRAIELPKADSNLFCIRFLKELLKIVFIILIWISLALATYAQYPLHLYMAIRIRIANEKFLEDDPENSWGFGQVIPLVLLIPVIREIGKAYIEYAQEKASISSAQAAQV